MDANGSIQVNLELLTAARTIDVNAPGGRFVERNPPILIFYNVSFETRGACDIGGRLCALGSPSPEPGRTFLLDPDRYQAGMRTRTVALNKPLPGVTDIVAYVTVNEVELTSPLSSYAGGYAPVARQPGCALHPNYIPTCPGCAACYSSNLDMYGVTFAIMEHDVMDMQMHLDQSVCDSLRNNELVANLDRAPAAPAPQAQPPGAGVVGAGPPGPPVPPPPAGGAGEGAQPPPRGPPPPVPARPAVPGTLRRVILLYGCPDHAPNHSNACARCTGGSWISVPTIPHDGWLDADGPPDANRKIIRSNAITLYRPIIDLLQLKSSGFVFRRFDCLLDGRVPASDEEAIANFRNLHISRLMALHKSRSPILRAVYNCT